MVYTACGRIAGNKHNTCIVTNMCVYKYIEFLWRVIQLAFIVQVCFDAEAMPTEYALKYEKE